LAADRFDNFPAPFEQGMEREDGVRLHGDMDGVCPLCRNRCPLSEPKCSKGEAFVASLGA
jgi:hypothetical protein